MRCVLLHGFAGDPANWDRVALDRPALQAQVDGAAVELARVALPGHVGGGPVRASWDANLAEVARQLGACDAVIGYSLGARVALGLVATGRVPRAVLISVNPGISDAERPARRAGDAGWARMLRTEGLDAFLAAWQAQPLFATQQRAATEVAERRARRIALDPEQLARSLETMGLAEMPDYRADVARLVAEDRRSIALIAGADDAKFVALARALPAPLALIADSGHDPTLEQPAALAAAIQRALAA